MRPDFARTDAAGLDDSDLRFVLAHFPSPAESYEDMAAGGLALPDTISERNVITRLRRMRERNRVFVVFSFLSILELTQAQVISLTIGEGYNNFWISQKPQQPEQATDQDAG